MSPTRNDDATWILASVSHELRTPLNAVLGFVHLLRSDEAAAAETQRYLKYLDSAARHLAAVVDDLVDLPQIQTGTLSLRLCAVPVADVVDEALAMVAPAARQAEVPIVVDAGDAGASVWADRLRMRQVLLNLLGNAVKYNRRGGKVHVRWVAEDGTVRVAVHDHGAGLNPQQMARLFEPFNRLGAEHTSVGGMGIGLVIARGLARMMHGDIEAQSQPDEGSTFSVLLPSA